MMVVYREKQGRGVTRLRKEETDGYLQTRWKYSVYWILKEVPSEGTDDEQGGHVYGIYGVR